MEEHENGCQITEQWIGRCSNTPWLTAKRHLCIKGDTERGQDRLINDVVGISFSGREMAHSPDLSLT